MGRDRELPQVLDVRREPDREQQIRRAITDDLVGDVTAVVRLQVPGARGVGHRAGQLRRAPTRHMKGRLMFAIPAGSPGHGHDLTGADHVQR